MKDGQSQLVLNNKSIEFLTSKLTMFAQVLRAMRMHEEADRIETIRNTIYSQVPPME